MGVLVLLKEPLEEGARGGKDYLVSSQLTIILSGQGHIRQIGVKPELFKDFWTFLVEIIPGESENIFHFVIKSVVSL